MKSQSKSHAWLVLVMASAWMWAACEPAVTSDPAVLAQLPERVDYNHHIKPILSDRCYQCHGPHEQARKAELQLHTEAGAKAALASGGHAIMPGSLRRSKLYQHIRATDPDEVMPPPESNLSLSEYEKALIGRWIEDGAEWKPHWAFTPLTKHEVPEGGRAGGNPIDHFVQARLDREDLTPSPEADPIQLLRRVTFDLTGLPPTVEEVDAFLADDSPDAYENVVDRLLASEAYGERMAVEWLDVARYADSHGYQADRERRMWPWRDWVIQAFNDNMPFDQFVTWQLAGDLLPEPTKTQRLATAFNRNHMQTEEGGSVEEEFRVEYVADRTHTLGTAFLGLTMECARCHDHKFDPLSQKEYYQFFAFFNNVDESGQTSHYTDAVPVPTLLLSDAVFDSTYAALKARIRAFEQRADTVFTPDDPAYRMWLEQARRTPPRLLEASFTQPRGLVAHYPLDEIQGDQLVNTVDTRRPGTVVDGPEEAPGYKGQALRLNGDNMLIFPEVGVFSRSDPFSLSLWVQVTDSLQNGVIVHRTQATLDAGSRGYEVSLEDGRLTASLTHMWPHNMVKVAALKPLPLNLWVHLALTYDGSSRADGLTLYLDGEQAVVEVARNHLFKDILYERVEVNLAIGARFRGRGFKGGLVDDFMVFDRALTSLEVASLSGKPGVASVITKQKTQGEEALYAYFLANRSPAYAFYLAELRRLRAEESALITPVPEIMVMHELPEPRPAYILERGAYDAPGEPVFPETPEALPAFPDDLPRNRLGLARWLTAPEHPLTARVTVNRYWQLYFGTGLVATAEDFGNQGARPTHPLLLDWLASTFIASGWNVKALQKQIVMSATYRQSSNTDEALRARDPANALLARGPSHRLPAEMIRDNALAASGVLVQTVGGPSVKPYQPPGLWEEKSGARYEQDHGEALYRRSMYTFWKRTSPPPSMVTFDAAERNICVARRQKTSTPMQALVLLNDPQFVEAARLLAERVLQGGGNRLAMAFQLLTSRPPRPEEEAVLQAMYEEQRAVFAQDPAAARALLTTGEHPRDASLDVVELAAMTQVASALMNFDATITKR